MRFINIFYFACLLSCYTGCKNEIKSTNVAPDPVSQTRGGAKPSAQTEQEEERDEVPNEELSQANKLYRTALDKIHTNDMKSALLLLEQSCEKANGTACYQLGMIYRNGKGVRASDEKARAWFQQACYVGSTSGCDALGH